MRTLVGLAVLCLAVHGCLLPVERRGGNVAIHGRDPIGFRRMPVGEGDRFRQGHELPVGLGQAPQTAMEHLFNVAEVDSALKSLARAYPGQVTTSMFHLKTVENRSIVSAQVGSRPRVFLTGGMHARERGGPDILIYFVSDLLWANASGRGLAYGNRRYSREQVRAALGAGVILTPLVNPDGVAYDQRTNSCWRKNRNVGQRYRDPADPRVWFDSVGVDINRNFATLFDFKRFFSPLSNILATTSDEPATDVYTGPGPESEVETKSVMDVLRRVKSLSWYLDLHSVAGQVLYSWGHDLAQTADPGQSFTNSAYDGKRGVLDDEYKEFMDGDLFAAQQGAARRMAEAMVDAGGATNYSAIECATLAAPGIDPTKGYPAWGTPTRPWRSTTARSAAPIGSAA